MKNLIKTFVKTIWVAPLATAVLFSACKKDDNEGGKGAPTIEKVRLVAKNDTIPDVVHRVSLTENQIYADYRVVAFDSTVVAGALNTMYAIVGTNLKTTSSISLNGMPVFFNPTLVTDKSVLVNTGTLTPYGPGKSDEIILTTKYGTVTYKFPIKQPAPRLTSFAPVAGGAGEIVTIKGTIFENLIAVRFDDTPAEIVGTPTSTEVRVKVPAGIVQAFIYVETSGGISKSAGSFGFKSLVYADAFNIGWKGGNGWAGTTDSQSSTIKKRGTSSLAISYAADGYGGFKALYNGATLNATTAGLTALKISVYGGAGSTGQQFSLSMNGDYSGTRPVLTLTEGQWTDYTIPFSALKVTGDIKEIIIQRKGSPTPLTNAVVLYVDDLGFI